ncbi:MAG: cell division protein ZapE [Pseudomonadota bacterium]
MSQHTYTLPAEGGMSPKIWYQETCSQPGFVRDEAQAEAIEALDTLWQELVEFKSKRNHFLGRSLLSPDVPKGLYIWGGVGRGKTFLMDAFYACVPYRRKRRIHFHNFMAEVHHELKILAVKKDPLIALADHIAVSTRLLCFDEFHVSDIADAMILGRLMTALLERGVVLLITSNYSPDDLYPHGLQRENFLPAIGLLQQRLKVLNMDGGHDYRLREMAQAPLFMVPANTASIARMDAMFERLSKNWQRSHDQLIEIQGRPIAVKKLARGVIWFDFQSLCGGPRGQLDYLEIAHKYPTVFLSDIPELTVEDAAAVQRFIWLVDVFYDNNVKLVASAAAVPAAIYTAPLPHGEFSRTVSRLTEMQSRTYLELPHQAQGVTFN